MKVLRIEDPPDDLYDKVAKMVERSGAKAVVATDKVIVRCDKNVYTYRGTNHDSVWSALAYALGADKIRYWFVVEKDKEEPTKLRAIEDEVLTYRGSIKESRQERDMDKEVNTKSEYIKKITG